MHDIHIEVGTPLAAGIGVDDLAVNSYHHQAIRVLGGGGGGGAGPGTTSGVGP
ncbi:gamma-glutamyl-gamma-aminobutyrate hydrolase family protein [Bifidobacterium pseudolongum]|uniref:gamma-glutamyl-gamma-aminobutyrate hydrolase family protein n=1 Tax=Bifidobacterium pseudolongum TaxID=1694 RepID=UPI0024140D8A|nr:gamma-glutamyl-gamma-aminobutyrate hydrolase family protein [Bifidobacterium pseudolongum]